MKSEYVKNIWAVVFLALVRAAHAEPPSGSLIGFEGIVEAERQTVIAAQISGAIVEITVAPGDSVKKGQVLLHINSQAAAQAAVSGHAQAASAKVSLDLAQKELDRQKRLFEQAYLSQAALDRAEAKFKIAEAEAHARVAQARAAENQAEFYTIRAPYAGIISAVPVVVGNMAMPGSPLLTLYDPSALRITANIPQSAATAKLPASAIKADISVHGEMQSISSSYVKLLPAIDATTGTAEIRLGLPTKLQNVAPGMFARVWLPIAGQAVTLIRIPLTAVVRHAEMTGAYVLDASNRPLLRQIRLGHVMGDQVEVLSGISADEHVVQNAKTALNNPSH